MFYYILIGLFLGACILLACLAPRLKTVQHLDEELRQHNISILKENQQLNAEKQNLEIEINKLNTEKNNLKSSIFSLNEQAEQSAELLYEKNMQLMQEKLEKSAEQLSNEFKESEEAFKDEYLKTLQECVSEYRKTIDEQQFKLNSLKLEISTNEQTMAAIVEANKRAQELKDKEEFFRLNISKSDLDEINILREAGKKLRNTEALNKVIWKVYYEKPYTDLVGRVIGNTVKTGIYKITDIENQKCYVGQAVDIADRWRQHIKRGLGAETPTKNKLYPVMLEKGVENFTFELIEECPREQLNAREDYWQQYYKAREFGYSIK